MYLALQIGVGIWIGGVFLAGTTWACVIVAQISQNVKRGRLWHRDVLSW